MDEFESPPEGLARLLEEVLSPEDWALLRGQLPSVTAEDYDAVIRRVALRAGRLEANVSRNQEPVSSRYLDLIDQPELRQLTVLRNSQPQMLVALSTALCQASWAERFEDVKRSLSLARLAVDAADLVAERNFLSSEDLADLRAEVWAYLGNALRINSELREAERSLAQAEDWRLQGTGDRLLKATVLQMLGYLRHDQGRLQDAAELHDREIAVRRLLGDREGLGMALIARGRTAIWTEPISDVCSLLREGVMLVHDPRIMVVALLPLAEMLARTDEGLEAWKALCTGDLCLLLMGGDRMLELRQQWTKGVTYRVLGDLRSAEDELRAARAAHLVEELPFQAALVSLDLACVYAAQGRMQDVIRIAEECHSVFSAQGVEEEALVALLMLQNAARAEKATEQLAVTVANFLVRYQHNRSLRFEPRTE